MYGTKPSTITDTEAHTSGLKRFDHSSITTTEVIPCTATIIVPPETPHTSAPTGIK